MVEVIKMLTKSDFAMKKIFAILFAVAMFASMAATAQTDEKLDNEFGARIGVELDYKIIKKLHVSLEEELRFDNNLKSFDRAQTTLFLNYKLHKNIKIGAGYSMINGYSSSSKSFKNPRHRFMIDVKGTLKYGYWNFSLKERFQITHRTGDFNQYQNPTNALTLKSRLMVKYTGFGKFEPYASFELRHYLNAPVISAAFDGTNYLTLDTYSEKGEAGWFLEGFNGCYLNRYRGSIGVDIKVNKQNSWNIYFLGDYNIDKVVDANAEGTKLKSYTKETGFVGWLGVGYKYSF